ncbi:hypothetical protein [Egicoccus sp. AB-alg2]|uniref:hypothetical protein n=1 Tax=Egicoccus sp. AB-alg2 TaxID=3242693 RepID=UPI00359ED5A5
MTAIEPAAGDPPEATDLEVAITAKANPILAAGKTGYAWNAVDKLLIEALPVNNTRCKKAAGSGRAANVLTESNDKDIDLYLVFCVAPYTIKQFVPAAADRVSRFPNVRAVIIADLVEETWRVRGFVYRDGFESVDAIRDAFPAIKNEWVKRVDDEFEEEEDGPVVPSVDEDVFFDFCRDSEPTLDGLEALPDQFLDFAIASGVTLSRSVAVDLLASTLSNQLLLFAGASGSGKSTVARLLMEFFTSVDAWDIIEARRQMIGPEDVAGFYSSITGEFAFTIDTASLLALQDVSVNSMELEGSSPPTPMLLVEEANLSAIDGYLSPVVHGMSRPSSPLLRWPLHAWEGAVENEEQTLSVPPTLLLGPYPRVLGTTNIDETAKAPARKVTSRSCVILLEPELLQSADIEAQRLVADPEPNPGPVPSQGMAFLGAPDFARHQLDVTDVAQDIQAFLDVKALAEAKPSPVSRRDVERVTNYMAYYRRLVPDNGEARRLAAENAYLHFILPNLAEASFSEALNRLNGAELAEEAPIGQLGGLLAPRIGRLVAIAEDDPFPEALDFWAALS